ncbi:MAG: hypothetical protein GY724_05675, partial [Actinomycetia bacterium]|nr:hypothetical protein [Actinomycetes bacterium]
MNTLNHRSLVASPGQATALDTADELPGYRRAGRVVLDVSRLLVVWWYATAPSAVVLYGTRSVILAVLVWVGLVVGSRWLPPLDYQPLPGLAVVGRLRVRVDHRHSLHRTTEVWYRLWWPRKA